MKKVLVFGITDNPGGVESVIMNYYRRIDREKINFDFLCNTGKVAYEDEIKSLGGKIYRVTARSKDLRKYRAGMDDFFKKHAKEYSAIWVNVCSLANIDYLIYAKKYGIPKRIIHCHNSRNMDSFARGLMHKFNRRRIEKYATDFWSCSKSAAPWFYSQKIINGDKFMVLYNSIDVDKFKFNSRIRKAYRNKLGLEDKIVFSVVGRLHFQKNQAFAIDIFNEVLKKHKNAVLLLIGDGEDKKKLKEQVKDLHIEKYVKFMGVRDDVEKLMQAADILLMPSIFEGLSLVAVEAQVADLVSVVSTGITDETIIVPDDVSRIDLNDKAKWLSTIEKIITGKKQREDISKTIKNTKYDINYNVSRLEENLLK